MPFIAITSLCITIALLDHIPVRKKLCSYYRLFSLKNFPMDALHQGTYRWRASGVRVLAHLFGFISIVLLLVWLLHYREGIDLDSDDAYRVFNVHPFLMVFGFILMMGEGMMAYKTIGAERQVQKVIHMFFHLIALVLGIVGLHAAFKFHGQANLTNLYSLHSWIGIGTFSLFCLQWLFGLAVFLFPGSSSRMKERTVVWHVSAGRALLFMAICAALTGLMEKVTFLKLLHHHEARVINFLGLTILLFGVTVNLSVSLVRYT